MSQRKRTHTQHMNQGDTIGSTLAPIELVEEETNENKQQQQQSSSTTILPAPFTYPSSTQSSKTNSNFNSEEQPKAKRRLNNEEEEEENASMISMTSTSMTSVSSLTATPAAAAGCNHSGIDMISSSPPSIISQDHSQKQQRETENTTDNTRNATITVTEVSEDTEMPDITVRVESLPSSAFTMVTPSTSTHHRQVNQTSSSSSSSSMIDAIMLRPTQISFTTVMVDLCMAKVLLFTVRKDRIRFGSVSKWWCQSVRHQSAWTNACVTDSYARNAPKWFPAVVSYLELQSHGFSLSFLHFTQVRTLELSNIEHMDVTLNGARRALQRLKLERLVMFEVMAEQLWSALFNSNTEADPSIPTIVDDSCHPAVWSWCESLQKLEMTNQKPINFGFPVESAFLTLSQRTWSKLHHFEWCTTNQSPQTEAMSAMQKLMTSSRLPSLITLDLWISADFLLEEDATSARGILEEITSRIEFPQLKSFRGYIDINRKIFFSSPSWISLTHLDVEVLHDLCQLSKFVNLCELHIRQQFQGTALSLFESIGHHSMPHLTRVTLPTLIRRTKDMKSLSQSDSDRIRAVMSQMAGLTLLRISFSRSFLSTRIPCWIDLISAFPSVRNLLLERFSMANSLSRAASFVPVIAAISSLECFSLEDDLILSFGDLSALALLWSTRQVDCRLNTISLKLPFRYGESPIEDDTMKAMLLSLAQLPQLTDLVIIRRPDEDDVNVRRKSPNEKTLSASYLPQLTRLKHLKRLHIDDYHYPIQWCVLEEWSRNSESFQYLRYLRIAFVKDFPSQTISYLTSLPHLHTIDFINTGLTSTIEPSVFETTVRELIRTANEGGRQPALDCAFVGKKAEAAENEEEVEDDQQGTSLQ